MIAGREMIAAAILLAYRKNDKETAHALQVCLFIMPHPVVELAVKEVFQHGEHYPRAFCRLSCFPFADGAPIAVKPGGELLVGQTARLAKFTKPFPEMIVEESFEFSFFLFHNGLLLDNLGLVFP